MPKLWLTAKRSSLTAKLDFVVLVTGELAVALGSVVLFGWYTHSPWLVQVQPTFAPMQYNAALSVLLCGLGLLALSWGRVRLEMVCGIVVAAIGLLTLYEYLFGLNLGLDQFFLQPFTTVRTSHPGRMAPQTALSCFLTGTVLVILRLPARHGLIRLLPALLSLLVGGLGLVGALGYLTGVPTAYQWQPFTDMAMLSAVGCVVLGVGVMAAAWRHYGADASGPSPWTPVLVGGGVTVVTLALWHALLAHESVLVRRTVMLAATSVQDAITEQTVSRLRSLERMAQHWEGGGVFSPEVWEQDLALLRRYDPYLQGVVWVDASFWIHGLGPLADEGVLGDPYSDVPTRQQRLLTLARTTQEAQVIRVADPRGATQELWMVVPRVTGTTFKGCLIGMLRLQPFLTHIATTVVEDFAVVVLDGEEPIYARHQTTPQYRDTLRQEVAITLPGLTWRVWIWPTVGAVLADKLSALPFAVLFMGLVTTVSLASLAYFAQTAQVRATQQALTNNALTKEISERQRTEEALRDSYQFLQSTLDALSASIVILEETATIVAVNAAWRRFVLAHDLSVSAHGVGTNYLEFCHAVSGRVGIDIQEFLTGLRAVMARQYPTFSWEYACHGPSEASWFLLQVTRFDETEDGRVVIAHEDISEIKRAEDALRRQQETLHQSEKLAALSGLLASVAHELNNPLAALMVQSDLLREQAMDSDLTEMVTDIHQAAVRCERIVRNFLTLARPNTPERTRVQLNDVVQEALQLLRYTLQLDEIDIIQQLADDLPVLRGDPHQLHQVVVNLLTNAHQALRETPPPHQIILTTQYNTAQQEVRLEVLDTGPGIPPALQARIFEPFFTTKPAGVGTGLGLSLCQSIIAGHEGTLRVESHPGSGARFVVTLPVAVEPSPEPPVPEPLPSTIVTGKAILVIDDEVGTAKALVRLFHRDGHSVDTAANGHLALAQLQKRPYDLILCDLRMPKLDGPGLYRSLAQDQPQLLPRFIFVTGDTLSPVAKAFLEDSQAPYLVKPFHAEEVRRIVQHALHRLEAL
jgi:signal transduction histidine kinase/CheY-like chemotaxis protein/sensor domain CHASE-containing protein